MVGNISQLRAKLSSLQKMLVLDIILRLRGRKEILLAIPDEKQKIRKTLCYFLKAKHEICGIIKRNQISKVYHAT